MSLPPVRATRAVPSPGFAIQDLLRDPSPVMVLDMGLGSREQSLPAYDPEPMRVVAKD